MDYFRIRTIKESLDELVTALGCDDDICLRDVDGGGVENTVRFIARYLNSYLSSLDDLELCPLSIGEDRKELERAQKALTLIDALTDVLSQVANTNSKLKEANYHARQALSKEGLFKPEMVYQMKEDFETISQLHTKHKRETESLIEQGCIATKRNAELKIQLLDREIEIKALKELVVNL